MCTPPRPQADRSVSGQPAPWASARYSDRDGTRELFKRWIQLVDQARASPGPFECPSCGAAAVWAVFMGDPATRVGAGWIWCDACLHGIDLSRTQVPESAHPFESDVSQRPRQFPNFKRVNRR